MPSNIPYNPIPQWPSGGGGSAENINNTASKPSEQQVSRAGDNDIIPVIYGMPRLAPKIVKYWVYSNKLYTLAVWGYGEITGFVKWWGDNKDITTPPNLYNTHYRLGGADNETIPSVITGSLAGYTDKLNHVPPSDILAPGVAYSVYITAGGENQKIVNLNALVKGLKVYDPRTTEYTWSDNPALCLADFITNEYYGMGEDIDWNSVIDAANFCDTPVFSGGTSKPTANIVASHITDTVTVTLKNHNLIHGTQAYFSISLRPYVPDGFYTVNVIDTDTFTLQGYTYTGGITRSGTCQISQFYEKSRTLNLALDSMRSCTEWLDTLRTYASCWVVRNRFGVIELIPDRPGNSVKTFDYDSGNFISISNVVKRGITSTPNHLTLTYTDTSTGDAPYKSSPVIVYTQSFENGETIRPSTIALPGINRKSQAYREAFERLNKMVLNDLSLDIEVFDDGVLYSSLGTSYLLNIGHIVGLKYVKYGIFTGNINSPQPKLMRVTKITAKEAGRYIISLIEYDPAVYSTEVIEEPTVVDTGLPSPADQPATVTNLQAYEDVYKLKDGTIASRFFISWTGAEDFWPLGYNVIVTETSDTAHTTVLRSETVPALSSTAAVFGPVVSGSYYKIQVDTIRNTFNTVSTTTGGTVSSSTNGNIVTYTSTGNLITALPGLGKLIPPDNVQGFQTFITPKGVRLEWNEVTDIDMAGYKVREGNTAWSSATPALKFSGLATFCDLGYIPPGYAYYYKIKAFDSSKNESAVEATAYGTIPTISTISTASIIPTLNGKDINIIWNAPASSPWPIEKYLVEYNVNGGSWNTAGVSNTLSMTYRVQAGWLGAGPVLFRVSSIDVAGYTSTPAVSANPLILLKPSAALSPTFSIDGEDIFLTWNSAFVSTATSTGLAISSYTVSWRNIGSTAAPTVLATGVTSLSYKIFPWSNANGTRTQREFYVTPYDILDTTNTPSTTNSSFSVPNAPGSGSATPNGNGVLIQWAASINSSLPIKRYRVQDTSNLNWSDSTKDLYRDTGLSYHRIIDWASNKTFAVVAEDIGGAISGQLNITATITVPSTPTVTSSYEDLGLVLSWNDCRGTLPIRDYKIIEGANTYTTSALYSKPFDYWTSSGSPSTKTFYVSATDIVGNTSASHTLSVTPTRPNTVTGLNYSIDSVDGTCKLYWTMPAKTSLPITTVRIQRGNNLSTFTYSGTDVFSGMATEFKVPMNWKNGSLETFVVAVQDKGGNISLSNPTIQPVASLRLPRTVSLKYVDTFVEFGWTHDTNPTNCLPLQTYQVQHITNTTTGASLISRVTGATTVQIPESEAYNKTYQVLAVDSAGNVSTYVNSGAYNKTVIPTALSSVTSLTAAITGTSIKVTWAAPSISDGLNRPLSYYKILKNGDYIGNTTDLVWSNNIAKNDLGVITFTIIPVDKANVTGATATTSVSVTAPAAVTGISHIFTDTKIDITWVAPSSTLPIQNYKVTYNGTDYYVGSPAFSLSNLVGWTLGTTRNIVITAIDILDNLGTASASYPITYNRPSTPTNNGSSIGGDLLDQFKLSWNPSIVATTQQAPIDEYEFGYCTGYTTDTAGNVTAVSGSTNLKTTYSTQYIAKADWATGTRNFWIKTYDKIGNTSYFLIVPLSISAPLAPTNYTGQVVDNNVLLNWTESVPNPLPIKSYMIKRGIVSDTWETAKDVGPKSGGFTTVFETASGTYKYFIAAIDSAGNMGASTSVVLTVSQPPDYVLNAEWYSSFADNLHPAPFNFGAWTTGSGITLTSGQVSYDGSTSGYILTDTNTVSGQVSYATGITPAANIVYCTSLFIKQNTATPRTTSFPVLRMSFAGGGNGYVGIAVDISNGQFTTEVGGTGASISHKGVDPYTGVDGSVWYHCYISGSTSTAAGITINSEVYPAAGAGSSWTYNSTTTGSITCANVQTIQGTHPIKYINVGEDSDGSQVFGLSNIETFADHFTQLRVSTATVVSAGSGYAVGDVIQASTGTGTSRARFTVATLSGSGIATVTVLHPGAYTTAPSAAGACSTVKGTGSGATLTCTTAAWNSPSSQVTASFPVYMQPGNTPSVYEETFDYGTVLAGTKVTVDATRAIITGTPIITPKISLSEDNITYTPYNDTWFVFGTKFRYVRVTLTVTDGQIDMSTLKVTLDTKLKNDAGTVPVFNLDNAAYSQTGTSVTITATGHNMVTGQIVNLVQFTGGTPPADNDYTITSTATNTFTITANTSVNSSGTVDINQTGTPVYFNVPFIDVENGGLIATPIGAAARIAVCDFVDAPTPTKFKVYLFDTAGARANGLVSWSAKGY